MKSLDQDFFVNAAQGRDLLVKIQELEKENKELERTVKLLQEKTATLMKQRVSIPPQTLIAWQ